jgi:hypothetical protein
MPVQPQSKQVWISGSVIPLDGLRNIPLGRGRTLPGSFRASPSVRLMVFTIGDRLDVDDQQVLMMGDHAALLLRS